MALSTNCWKYLVLCFNVVFAMSALVLFAGSGLLLYRIYVYRHFVGMGAQYPVILLLMMSIITCSVAWIGWRTAKSMHQIHVIITGILIFLVVAIEFSCFVWAMVVWDNIELDLRSTMTDYFHFTVQLNNPNSVDALRWDKLHSQMQCCGVSGASDYGSTGHMPFSCCGQGPQDAIHIPYISDCNMVFQRGCVKQLHKYLQEQLLIVAGTALLASVLQSTGIFCTFFLANAIGKRRRASAYRLATSARDSTLATPDDSLLQAPTAPAPTLPKF